MATDNEQMNPARSLDYLRNHTLQSIYSNHVKTEVMRMDPRSEEDLLSYMVTVVYRNREANSLDCGIVQNPDGLASTPRLATT